MPKQRRTWVDVWSRVRARQRDLGWRDADIYEMCRISQPTYRAGIIDGKPLIRPNKISGLEDGLGWERGSIERILRGEEPLPVPTVNPSDVPDDRVLARLAVSQAVEELEEGYRLLKAELAEVQDRLAVLEGRNLASGS